MLGQKYTPEELDRIISGGENTRIEFRRRLPPDQAIARILAALANTEGGLLVVGVDDDRTVVGENFPEAIVARERIQKIGEILLPGRIRVDNVVSGHGRVLTLAEVDPPTESDGPVLTARGQLWQRMGSANVPGDFASYASEAVLRTEALKKGEVIVFVAMSFRTEEEPVLEDYAAAMERAAQRSRVNVKLKRIDQVEGDYEISQEIMNQIDASDVLLADFTLSPQNVYFEVGYARGGKKAIIQTARRNTVLEFDVRNWRTLFYRNATQLEELLVKAFDALEERDKPVSESDSERLHSSLSRPQPRGRIKR
jgi:hypothetical protein